MPDDSGGIAVGIVNDDLGVLAGLVNASQRLSDFLLPLIGHCGDIQVQIFCVDECLLELCRQVNVKKLEGLQRGLEGLKPVAQPLPHLRLNAGSFIKHLQGVELGHHVAKGVPRGQQEGLLVVLPPGPVQGEEVVLVDTELVLEAELDGHGEGILRAAYKRLILQIWLLLRLLRGAQLDCPLLAVEFYEIM